jgi:hypothetical protein
VRDGVNGRLTEERLLVEEVKHENTVLKALSHSAYEIQIENLKRTWSRFDDM